jgi:2-dehydropantoate 2-reductase
MRCLIWGAGAIGGTLGAYLARAGHDVTLVDTAPEHVAAVNRSGLTISGPIAAFTTPPLAAFTPDTLRGTWDTIILATKAHHTETAARALAPHLTRAGCVVSAQNGLNELAIAEVTVIESHVEFGAVSVECRRGIESMRIRRKLRRRCDRPRLSNRGTGAQKQQNNKQIDTFHGSSFYSRRRN